IIPIDVIRFSDNEISNLIAKMERDPSTFSLLGYSSALELICRYLERTSHGRVKADVSSVIAISETLNDYTRQGVEKYFGVKAVSRYSNLENGIIAQQLPADSSGRFLINSASYFVEVLKMDSDKKALPGEPGRIVVTDLFNYAMPMIRYDTGDIGSMTTDCTTPGRQYLDTVEGRKMDLLNDTAGNLVSSFIVYKNMWHYTEIDQYQLIQEGAREYTFKINCSEKFTREEQLIREFKTYLGNDADFRIEYVSEIPLLSSGKRKKIVNNFIVE
ncbi:MAG: CoF synthetase, partial [Bacteroidales bacterium]|nr:CoF synthetase [Bacteroidales bacterium]